MKIIKYMGYEYEVPDWVKFITTDEDGDIYVFEMMPDPQEDDVFGFWVKKKPTSQAQLLGNRRWDWKKTLVEIEE